MNLPANRFNKRQLLARNGRIGSNHNQRRINVRNEGLGTLSCRERLLYEIDLIRTAFDHARVPLVRKHAAHVFRDWDVFLVNICIDIECMSLNKPRVDPVRSLRSALDSQARVVASDQRPRSDGGAGVAK